MTDSAFEIYERVSGCESEQSLPGYKRFRIIEFVQTSEGRRTRVPSVNFKTKEDAQAWITSKEALFIQLDNVEGELEE